MHFRHFYFVISTYARLKHHSKFQMPKPPVVAYIIEFYGNMQTFTPTTQRSGPSSLFDFRIEGTCQLLVRFIIDL